MSELHVKQTRRIPIRTEDFPPELFEGGVCVVIHYMSLLSGGEYFGVLSPRITGLAHSGAGFALAS